MAEFVEQRMQHMIGEFDELEKIQILSPNEVRKLVQKRREFEYRIAKRRRRKHDYINYVIYDTKLLELLYLRRTEFGEKSKQSTIEGAISKRILHRLSFMTKLWPSHLDIWALRISFSKSRHFDDGVSTIYAEQTRFHGHLESIWIAWADWEVMQRNNFIKARDILLSKARRYHPNSLFIAREYFRLELLYIRHLREESKVKSFSRLHEINVENREKILNCSVPEAIYKDAVEKFPGTEVYLQFHNVVKKFPFAKELEETIFGDLVSKHPNDGVSWKLRLNSQLYTKPMDDAEAKPLCAKDKIKKIFEFYNQARRVVGSSFMNIYFGEVLNLLYQSWSIDPLFKEIANKMVLLCKDNMPQLSALQFLAWFQLSKYMKVSSNELVSILDQAALTHPHSSIIKLELINEILLDESEDQIKMKVFEKHSRTLHGSNGLQTWIKMIETLKENNNKVNMLEKAAQNVDNEIAIGIRVYYLGWIFKTKGVKNLRRIYKKYEVAPPLSNDVHATYIGYELKSKSFSLEEARKAFESATKQFGLDYIGVWFSYIEFERKYGKKTRIGHLYSEARDKLDAKYLTQFIDLRYVFEDMVEKDAVDSKRSNKSKNPRRSFVDSADNTVEAKFEENFCVDEGTCKNLFDEAPFLNFTNSESRKKFFKLIWDTKHLLEGDLKVNHTKNGNNVWEVLLSKILGEEVSLSLKEIEYDEDDTQKCVKMLDEITLKRKSFKKIDKENSLVSNEKVAKSSTQQSEMEELLSHSDTLKPDFLKQKRLEPYFIKKVVLKRRNKKLAKKNNVASEGWFNMKTPSMTKEIRRDMQVLKMRSVLDPKTHYKRNDLKEIPKIFQMGKVVDNPLDFYSSRIPKKQRKRTLAEELISDEKGIMYQKRKHAEIVSKLRTKQRFKKTSKVREKREKISKTKDSLKNKNKSKKGVKSRN